jgi:hypothetical protein
MEILYFFGAGAFGALLKEILEDNKLKIPKIATGELDLGFLGALVLGAFAGYIIDGSFLTAAMGGFIGKSVIENLVVKAESQKIVEAPAIEKIIRAAAILEGVDPELAIRVARCESNLNPAAKNVNADKSIDRGLYQINNKYHPEVTDAQAYDPNFAAHFFCQSVKSGHLAWWNATKTCWEI